MDNQEKGVVYLIQPAELVGTKRYKIGCSGKDGLHRCKKGYKKGTRFLNIIQCSLPFVVENEIKRVFNYHFRLVAGNEYFEGDEEAMKQLFYGIVSSFPDISAIMV